jgi:hypothetical protein
MSPSIGCIGKLAFRAVAESGTGCATTVHRVRALGPRIGGRVYGVCARANMCLLVYLGLHNTHTPPSPFALATEALSWIVPKGPLPKYGAILKLSAMLAEAVEMPTTTLTKSV